MKATAVLGVVFGLLILPLGAALSTVLGPFSWPTGRSTAAGIGGTS